MKPSRILVVHPEPTALALLGSMIQSLGHTIVEASNDRVAVKRLEREGAEMVLAGADPDDGDALELLSYVRRKHPGVPVILLFPCVHPERAREAMRQGATVVLRYPVPANELRAAITQALDLVRASAPVEAAPRTNGFDHQPPAHVARPAAESTLNGASASPFTHPLPLLPGEKEINGETSGLIGNDPGLRQAIEMAAAIARNSTPVLIEGERGTGKTLLAKTLHQLSPRRDRPFISLACASLGDAMFERELFGHRAATSTDPHAIRPGALALAEGGTIFLDDLCSLSPSVQLQLVRVLRDGEYVPVGAAHPIKADVRFVLASCDDLGSLVEQGRFRSDLYYKIGVVRLKLPPLRHRGEDIERLAHHFLARFSREFDKPIAGFTPDALDLLRHHDWPGNVQELESVIQRGVVLCHGSRVTTDELSAGLTRERPARAAAFAHRSPQVQEIRPLKEALEEPEKQIIIAALRALNWNRQETARVLDINRTTLYKKMKKYGLLIDEPAWVN